MSVTFCLTPGDKQFLPRGSNISYTQGGGQTIFVGGGGGYDDVDEEMDVNKANFLVSDARIFGPVIP